MPRDQIARLRNEREDQQGDQYVRQRRAKGQAIDAVPNEDRNRAVQQNDRHDDERHDHGAVTFVFACAVHRLASLGSYAGPAPASGVNVSATPFMQ